MSLRRRAIGRKLSYGSHSADGAALQGVLLSFFATLDMVGIDLWRWLEVFLRECAEIGRRGEVDPCSLAGVGHVRGAVPGPTDPLAACEGRAGSMSGSPCYFGRDLPRAVLDHLRGQHGEATEVHCGIQGAGWANEALRVDNTIQQIGAKLAAYPDQMSQ